MQFCKLLTLVLVIDLFCTAAGYAADFKTPEDAIDAYIEAVKKQDFEAVVETTAIDRMSRSFDFVGDVEERKSLTILTPVPANSAFLVAVNKAFFISQIAQDIKAISYGLMTTQNGLGAGQMLEMDAGGAAEFARTVDTKRLSDLKLLKIGIPHYDSFDSEEHSELSKKYANKIYHAIDSSERVALISFEDRTFLIGFAVIRYENGWSVEALRPPPIKFSRYPVSITVEAFEKLIKD